MFRAIALICCLMGGAAYADPPVPPARDGHVPRARWDHRSEAKLWSRAAMAAMSGHGAVLARTVPADINDWCPAYPETTAWERRAFWVGFLSALSKHESTYNPSAVGGGGLWYGLTQILPATARGYGCRARDGAALKDGAANLSCAIRILATTVPRDGVIATKTSRWRGVAADWGPMRSESKRRDMARWLKRQTYCTPLNAIRPRARPD